MIYTIMPPEVVFAAEAQAAPALLRVAGGPELLARKGAEGDWVIERLLSTDPRHYLDGRWAPGSRLPAGSAETRMV